MASCPQFRAHPRSFRSSPARSDLSSTVNALRTVLYHGPIQPRVIGHMDVRKLSHGRRFTRSRAGADNVMLRRPCNTVGLYLIDSHLQGLFKAIPSLADAESPSVSSLWYVKGNSLRNSRIALLNSGFSTIQTQHTPLSFPHRSGPLTPMDFHSEDLLTEKNNEYRWAQGNLSNPGSRTSFAQHLRATTDR